MNISLFEKLSIVFGLLFSSPFTVLLFAFAIFICASLFVHLYVEKKQVKLIFPILYFVFLGILVFQYQDYVIKGISLYIDDLFMKAYFPSLSLYFTFLGINLIVLFITLFSNKITKYSKILNIVSFSSLQFLFALLLNTISTKKLDVTNWNALYEQKEILSLLEVSMGIFLLWIFFLFIGFAFHQINKHYDKKETEAVLTSEKWNELQSLIKDHIFTLTEEVERLKQELEKQNKSMEQRFTDMEDALEKTSRFFVEQFKTVTKKVDQSDLQNHVKQLEQQFLSSQKMIEQEFMTIRHYPNTELEQVKEKMIKLEKMMHAHNEKIYQQLELLKVTPSYEMDKIKDQMKALDILLKRYQNDMNYELQKTKKELLVQMDSKNKRTQYRNLNDVEILDVDDKSEDNLDEYRIF